jgi:hypothetical protein
MASHKRNPVHGTEGAAETITTEAPSGESTNGAAEGPPVDPSPDPVRVQADDKPVELLNKIVAKDIVRRSAMNYHKVTEMVGDKEVVSVKDNAPRSLYRVFGIARDVKHGDSQYGEWTSFLGSFEAIRFSDRQRFQAPQCFLQGASEALLLDALLMARKEDTSATVMFAFDIGVKPSSKWITEDKGNSYEYTVRTVLKTEQHDPLKEIRNIAAMTLPALPAPTK